MDQFSFQIFLENICDASILPLGADRTYLAMIWFGGYDMLQPSVWALTGATIGCLVNWWIGWLLSKVREKNKKYLSDAHYAKGQKVMRTAGLALLFLWAFIPFGPLWPMIAGFFRMKWWQVAIIVAAGHALYLYYLFSAAALAGVAVHS